MKNSEILYLYDAKLTNPNGDPDEENRPRMDEDTNLVTDLRLKRYIREYLLDKGHELYVQQVNDMPVTGSERVKDQDLKTPEGISAMLNHFADVRLFGATMPIKENNLQFTGPVQFNWGYSLNKVDVLESSITSTFASSEGKKQGAIGKDYRVKYSFVAFSGVISARRAEKTNLTDDDVKLMDEALKYAIPQQATRSKIGQYPRLYLRVEYQDAETVLGDLRSYLDLDEKEGLSDISDVLLKIDRLVEFLIIHKEKVKKIHYFCDPQLRMTKAGKECTITDVLSGFDLCEIR